jgi:Tfp pilus assembly protein PilX
MMKSACFLAVLALCTAGAPPRISLVLNERLHKGSEDLTNGATVVAEKLGAYHDQAHKSASYAEACNLNSDRSKCVFPVAKGFDADYGTVDVKTTINRMARNGDITQYITPTSGDDAKSFHNAQDVLDKYPRKDMLSRTGAFLFQYEAESQGQTAEVVTFFLLVNDIEAPKFVGADKCDMGMNKGGKKNVIDAVSGSFNDRAISKCIDAITCTDNSGSFDKTCQDTQGNNQKCGKINYEGTLETRDQKASATVTCTDRAGLYGKNGESNKVVKHFHWNGQDTTPPKCGGLTAVPP